MFSKVPPHSIEAEQSVLGGLMMEPEAWDDVADVLTPEDFYKPTHQKIYGAIRDLHRKSQPTDLITVSNALMGTGDLETIGGPSYLAELLDLTPSAANIATHAHIVNEKSLLRKLIHLSQKHIEGSYSQSFEDIASYLDSVESDIFNLVEEKKVQGLVEAGEIVKLSLEKLEALYEKKVSITGVPSGFVELDDMTSGFQPGELTIIAARPSMGKTAFSLNIALACGLKEKRSVAYFSLEMGKEQLMMRLLAGESKINMSDLRVGHVQDKLWPKLISAAAQLSESKIFIDDSAGVSPFEIRAKCRRMKAKYGLDIIMIDYLQLMSLKQRVESREREVSEISKLLKSIAKELQVPVIALAQLNRGVEGRSDRRPMLSDLRESGSIEQDADVIMMLYREDYYDRDNPEIKGVAEVIVGKQRNGPTGTVKLRWVPSTGSFKDYIEGSLGPPPPMPDSPSAGYQSHQGGGSGHGSNQGRPRNFAPGSSF